jgi:hypothetical protein
MEKHLRLCEIFKFPKAPIKDNIIFYKYERTLRKYIRVTTETNTPLKQITAEPQITHLRKQATQQFQKIKRILDNNETLQEYVIRNL